MSDSLSQQGESVQRHPTNSNLLETVFNTSTLALHVLKSMRNEQGRIVDFDVILTNTISEKMAGRKVTGMRMLEGWPHTKEIGLFDKFVTAVDTGVAAEYEQFYEADGVRAWFRWLATRLDDGLYVTIEDISEQKRYEESLKLVVNNLQSTFDGVPALIALLEPAGDHISDFIISSANKALADFLNQHLNDLVGKRISEVYPEVFSGDLMKRYQDVLASGNPSTIDYYFKPSRKWLSIVISRQANAKGLVAVAIDVTSTKRNEEEHRRVEVLTQLDKVKTDFFNNVSHEFRTPITLIQGPVEDLLEDRSIAGRYRPKLEMIHRNVLRLQKQVNALLDFSWIESGKSDVVFQPTNLCEYTTNLASSFRSAIERANLQFVVECEPTEPVYVNRIMWEKIVFNLLSNALKFTLKGSIKVQIKSNIKNVQLLVCDTGVGIPTENHEKIFDRFVRLENTYARTFEGSGIGLALVKELVEIHHGKIKVKSKPGHGSEFVITLPKGKRHLSPKKIHEFSAGNIDLTISDSFVNEANGWISKPTSLRTPRNAEKKNKILLVDDNTDLRDYINGILKYDFDVTQASNGGKAASCLDSGFMPDLILSDIMMPEVNGYEFLSFVKRSPLLRNIPFIFLTAKASENERVEGITKGVDSYLVKPFSAKELLAIVHAQLALKKDSVEGD